MAEPAEPLLAPAAVPGDPAGALFGADDRLERAPRQAAQLGSVLLWIGIAVVMASTSMMTGYSLLVVAIVGTQIIAALSLNVLMGYAGQVSLGQAAFVGVGAFAAAQLAEWLPFPIPLLGAVVVASAVATVVGLPSLRIRGLQVAATTLAFGVAAGGVLFARPWSSSSSSGMALRRPELFRGNQSFALLVWATVLLVVALDHLLRHSRLGRTFTVVRDREENAAAWGIPVGRTKLLAYAVSGAYAGAGGALFAYLLQRVTPQSFDIWASLGLVAAAVIGGRGSLAGVAIAEGALSAGPELLRSMQFWAPFIGAIALVAVPTLRPEGLGWIIDRPLSWFGRPHRRKSGALGRWRDRCAPLDVAELTSQPARPVHLSLPARTVLEVRDLSVAFGGLAALDGVNLEIRRHQIVGLIGPNGAGKTTLFNCVSGFVTPTRGRVLYHGIDLLSLPSHARQGLGLARTFQQVGLCLPQTVRANLLIAQHPYARGATAADVLGLSARRRSVDVRRRADEVMALLGLTDVANTRVGDLPHVRQRVVELAAALAISPEVLLLDEPASGLTPVEAGAFVERLQALREELGLTILLIEHHLPVVTRLCDYVYVMAEGCVLASGRPAEMQSDPAVISVYLRNRREEAAHLAG